MTDEELKAALEALIAKARAKGPGRIPTEAERHDAIRFGRVQ